MMLVATGRAANVEEIGLETTKAEVERGFIKVDGRMRTRSRTSTRSATPSAA